MNLTHDKLLLHSTKAKLCDSELGTILGIAPV